MGCFKDTKIFSHHDPKKKKTTSFPPFHSDDDELTIKLLLEWSEETASFFVLVKKDLSDS